MQPKDLKYTREHEWIRVDGDVGTVGITDHAQQALSDVVYVELPEVGKRVAGGDEAAVLESTKAAASIYAPVGGTITAPNNLVAKDPGVVNTDCYGEGWIFKMRIDDPSHLADLMDAEAYERYLAEQDK
jgi:glycine cleavage system H protein